MKYKSSSTRCSKVISKVKVSERRTELQNYRMTELQNYRMTDRTKTICPPIFDLGGIKIRIITKCIIVEIFRIIAYWNTVFVYDAVLLFDAEPGFVSLLWLVARDGVTLKSL